MSKIGEHAGAEKIAEGFYTYEHAEAPSETSAEMFKIKCHILFVNRPIHINTYYIEADRLNEFLAEQCETGEIITDIRPITREQAKEEIKPYLSAKKGKMRRRVNGKSKK